LQNYLNTIALSVYLVKSHYTLIVFAKDDFKAQNLHFYLYNFG